ncbi:MAG: flavodoxin domain-containing protein [Candidatus Bathyarchaeia archaeon]
MTKILVLYYSRTGNTEKMAHAVAEGARTVQGVEVKLDYHVTPEELASFDAIAVGTPTYHHDMSTDMKTLFEEAAVKNVDLKNKVGAAFGSYGWSGEAPRLVLEILKNKFQMRTVEPPLIVKYEPDQVSLAKCRELGRKIADLTLSA